MKIELNENEANVLRTALCELSYQLSTQIKSYKRLQIDVKEEIEQREQQMKDIENIFSRLREVEY